MPSLFSSRSPSTMPSVIKSEFPSLGPSLSSIPPLSVSLTQQPSLFPSQSPTVRTTESILRSLYDQTNGPSWYDNNWFLDNAGSYCSFVGISCEADGFTIYEIDLYDMNLNGKLPTSLGYLDSLKYLYLGENTFSSGIPSEFGLLDNIEYLNIYNAELKGTIPTELGLMANISKCVFEYYV